MRSLPLLLLLTACAGDGVYPSLRPRAFEAAGPPGLPVPPPPAAPPASANILEQTAALVARGEAGQAAFARALPATRAAVSRAGPANGESWIEAHKALSALDATRAATITATAELDSLNASGVDAAGLTLGDNDFAAIRRAGERLNALGDAQTRAIGALAGSLAPA